jgi:hypothetical protein
MYAIVHATCLVGADDDGDVDVDERNVQFFEHNKRSILDKVRKCCSKLSKFQKELEMEFVLVIRRNGATYSSTSNAAIGLVEGLSLSKALAARVALADSKRRSVELMLPQMKAADLVAELPTRCLQHAVGVMLDALVPDRRSKLPYHSTPRDHVTQLLPWFPAGVVYTAPSKMNKESLESLVAAVLEHCAADCPVKFIKALSDVPMEPQHMVRLEHLINLGSPERRVNTGT